MDWNKSNSILIIAFVVLNIFLFASFYNNTFSDKYDVMADEQFVDGVEKNLQQKNITISCDIPDETYILPVLETEYEIIEVNNELLNNYLGPGIDAIEDVYVYNNSDGETLEIIDGKKLRYTIREKVPGKTMEEENVKEEVLNLIKEKNINVEDYQESSKCILEDECVYTYTRNYNGFSIDNSYMRFFADSKGIYKFEMQRISLVIEIMGKVRVVPAMEALTRLMTYEDIRDKEITSIEMTYYSIEDENWQYIKRINSDPTWKVKFRDGLQIHLPSFD